MILLSRERNCKVGGKRDRSFEVDCQKKRKSRKEEQTEMKKRIYYNFASIRTDIFYRLIEPICMRESGGQSANGSTACEHLRRAGRPSTLRNNGDVPLSCCRARRSAAGCCCCFYSRPEERSPEGCSPRDTPLPEVPCSSLPGRTESSPLT